DKARVRAAFADLKSQELEFEIQRIEVAPGGSTAQVRGMEKRVAVPRVGSEQHLATSRVLTLEKRGDSWVITRLGGGPGSEGPAQKEESRPTRGENFAWGPRPLIGKRPLTVRRRLPIGLTFRPTEPRKLVESCSVATSCLSVVEWRSTGSVTMLVL